MSCDVLAAIPGGSDASYGSSRGSKNIYSNSEPPSMTLMLSSWFNSQATEFPFNPAIQSAQPGSLSPVFSSGRHRSLLVSPDIQIGIPLSVLLDSSTASGVVVRDAGNFNGSSSVSGGTIYTAFGSKLPFSMLSCAKGQSPGSGAASGCGVTAQDSSGNDLSGVIVSLSQLPASVRSLPLDAMVFNCDPVAVMQGHCLPGSYNLTYFARDGLGLVTMGYVVVVVEQRSLTRLWIAASESCSSVSGLQSQVR